ncbi:hypothetical protein C8F01DRAFT_1121640 [Mycena amicta]|nr:hypothetical protein C8F01DRAFT_1121640 [Mycena amicta]
MSMPHPILLRLNPCRCPSGTIFMRMLIRFKFYVLRTICRGLSNLCSLGVHIALYLLLPSVGSFQANVLSLICCSTILITEEDRRFRIR